MFIEYNYKLLDSESEFITAVGAERCFDEVHGECEVLERMREEVLERMREYDRERL